MNPQTPTKYKQYRYDPELKKVVLVREGEGTPVDPETLSPELRALFREMRKRSEEEFGAAGRKTRTRDSD